MIIAHRGDTHAGLENTMPAFESALKLGIDGIECDLQLSRDGRVVVFHDDDFSRLADREGKLGHFTFDELSKIRLAKDGRIPALEDLLELVRDRCLLNLEIKTKPRWHAFGSGRLERAVVDALKKFGLGDSIVVSSFHPMPLFRMRRLAPHLKRGVLFESKYWLHRMAIPLTAPSSLHPPLKFATPSLIHSAHDAGRRVLVWTVNAEDDMKKLWESGVDGIITDEPRRLQAILQGTSGQR
ncbi:MAG TPA: glycerophosphodiester phosphodiesterase family protein [bacterium]|nr:glycerophosphodiester phosphodiesterase family protein [bacterium]